MLKKVLIKFFNDYIVWRPNYYFSRWKKFKLLYNYNEIKKENTDFNFRIGYNILVEDWESANHIFSEIFIYECYPIDKSKSNQLIIDIGANVGFFTFYSLMKLKNAKIISIEADPKNYKVLKNNILSNNLKDRVQLLNKAVCSEKGKVKFYSSLNSAGWSSIYRKRGAEKSELIHVDAITITDILSTLQNKTVDIMKIDIEGAEYDVLLNDNFLDNFIIKKLFIEVDKKPRDKRFTIKQLLRYLDNYYKNIRVFDSDNEYPLLICEGYKND